MALDKRQKAFVAVFFLGLAALVVDRVFLRPQGGARKVAASAFEAYRVPASATDAAPAPAEAQDPTVAERLDRLWPERDANNADTRDPFSLTALWPGRPAGETPPAPDQATVFARGHPLQAVVMNGSESYILIDDRVLRPGERVEGFTLAFVGPKSATFERQGKRVVLELVNK
jgi:hypothetical protein